MASFFLPKGVSRRGVAQWFDLLSHHGNPRGRIQVFLETKTTLVSYTRPAGDVPSNSMISMLSPPLPSLPFPSPSPSPPLPSPSLPFPPSPPPFPSPLPPLPWQPPVEEDRAMELYTQLYRLILADEIKKVYSIITLLYMIVTTRTLFVCS